MYVCQYKTSLFSIYHQLVLSTTSWLPNPMAIYRAIDAIAAPASGIVIGCRG